MHFEKMNAHKSRHCIFQKHGGIMFVEMLELHGHKIISVMQELVYMGVLCKKFSMLFLQDHFGHIIIPTPLQRRFKNIYLIFKPNYIIVFFINFYNNYLPPFLIIISIL
jgi:hypothetical protein